MRVASSVDCAELVFTSAAIACFLGTSNSLNLINALTRSRPSIVFNSSRMRGTSSRVMSRISSPSGDVFLLGVPALRPPVFGSPFGLPMINK